MKAVARLLTACGLMVTASVLGQQQDAAGARFDAACAHCHGMDGLGTELGPSIMARVGASDDRELVEFLRTGVPDKGMPPAAVAEADLPALVDYLRFLRSAAGADEAAARTNAGRQPAGSGLARPFVPVSEAMLMSPRPEDWLWFSRTPDAQRFSPLGQIDKSNVSELSLAWSRALSAGLTYVIPIVYNGVMYLSLPDGSVMALDATTGDEIWKYERDYDAGLGLQNRAKTLSIFEDKIFFTAPDSTVVALDARTGALRWEADVGERGNSSGSIVVDRKVVSGGNCIAGPRDNCFIAAHDVDTGRLIWKFNTVQAPGDPPGSDTWAGAPLEDRLASPWGLPGSFDAETGLIYWGIANPMPNTRADRHGGESDAIPYEAPADLYSNSTVALDPATGELVWYYQHLPGDDWDLDMNQERVVVTTRIDPDPDQVRWINPGIERGELRDVVVNVGEGGGIWLLDKHTGEFIWSTPFPFDVDNFFLADINVETGRTSINRNLIVDEPGEQHTICYFNTRSFWPTAYHPGRNALYVPYIRNCLDMTSARPPTADAPAISERRVGSPEPGVPLDELNGLARIDLETGEMVHWPTGRIPTNSAILATAGDLIFWGDIDRRYRAMDAGTGEVLWQTVLGGPISMSNITYAVDDRQYVAVIVGDTLSQQVLTRGNMGPIRLNLDASSGNAAIYVFALPSTAVP